MSDKSASFGIKTILQEGGKIINDTHEIREIFNNYFTSAANDIGFDDSIPPDFYTTHGFSAMINKHCQHPSIVKIRENISNDLVFDFQCVNAHDISKIIKSFDGKKAHGYDMVPMKLLQKSAQHFVPDRARLINNSVISKGVPRWSILGPLIFHIFMNYLFHFVKRGNLFNYADDNSVSVNSKELNIVSQLLQSKAEVTVRWFCSNAMEANPSKFQGILFKGE